MAYVTLFTPRGVLDRVVDLPSNQLSDTLDLRRWILHLYMGASNR